MSEIVTTASGSLYEVDRVGRRVRRLSGTHEPTPRQGTDGEWKQFLAATPATVGQSIVIAWRIVGVNLEMLVTSPVVTINSSN